MENKKTVLIVEDNHVNLRILSRILDPYYSLISAQDGQAALDLLKAKKNEICAVMLDLIMPGMNGYEFLAAYREMNGVNQIPVIVSTGQSETSEEIRALELGAWDYIKKPYVPEIIRFRLNNVILRSQLSAFQELKYKATYDVLTGIYNKEAFFSATAAMLSARPDEHFAFLRFDVNRFHLINSYFGTEVGDRILQHIAKSMQAYCKAEYSRATWGRIEADVFALCFPYATDNCEPAVEAAVEACCKLLAEYPLAFHMVPSFGVFNVTDRHIPVNVMYDSATLASKSSKGSYLSNACFYTPEMRRRVEQEQEIINDMNEAIQTEQFQVWYQPKYDIRTNIIAGAEALVRWQHPQKGLIPPGQFIPLFEHNGFVSKLDFHVWRRVCRDLREWLDRGKTPEPVSVNVSRVDLSDPKLLEKIVTLTDEYMIPHSLLQLELTESAYSDNPEMIMKRIREFRALGFVILMDDFGSGYSSLSVLKDIEVDVLKIDMRFFSKSDDEGRGRSIISSVIRMAKWLGTTVIAEGVETKEQVSFLRGMGCDYVQGYYFAKPMNKSDYETLIFAQNRTNNLPDDRYTDIDLDQIWGDAALMQDIVRPAAILEYGDGKLEFLRINEAFNLFFCTANTSVKTWQPMQSVGEVYRSDVFRTVVQVCKTKGKAIVEYQPTNLDATQVRWVRVMIKYVDRMGKHDVILTVFSDVTAEKQLELALQETGAGEKQHT